MILVYVIIGLLVLIIMSFFFLIQSLQTQNLLLLIFVVNVLPHPYI